MTITQTTLGYTCINPWELTFGWAILAEGDGALPDGDHWRFGDCDGGRHRGWGGGGGLWTGH